MTTPLFLELDQVLRLHEILIGRYGGAQGVRDTGLVQSAIAQPRSSFGGQMLHRDIFEMAAAYLYHLVRNHPFVDGNKRIGAAAAIVFLSMNDIEIDNDEDGLVALTLDVAEGRADTRDVAEFFRTRAH